MIGYYQRFMQRFADVASLAAAPLDEVLHLWSGLGYYSRARNLQRAAQRIVSEYGGELPVEREQLVRLPGIGRSTAAAIVALAHGRRAAHSRWQRQARAGALLRHRGRARRSGDRARAMAACRAMHSRKRSRGLYAGDHGFRRNALHAPPARCACNARCGRIAWRTRSGRVRELPAARARAATPDAQLSSCCWRRARTVGCCCIAARPWRMGRIVDAAGIQQFGGSRRF